MVAFSIKIHDSFLLYSFMMGLVRCCVNGVLKRRQKEKKKKAEGN